MKVLGSLQRTDSDIAQAVRHALEWDVLVPADQICSTVTNGWVTLECKVEHYSERVDAEHALHNLTGVHGVTNKIDITTPVDPERVKFEIEDVLEVRADREANRIKVRAEEGEVTLIGIVNSWAEKKVIMGAVGHAPGVTANTTNLSLILMA